jgi:hypothetical protein
VLKRHGVGEGEGEGEVGADFTSLVHPRATPIASLDLFSATSLIALPTTVDVQPQFAASRLVLS